MTNFRGGALYVKSGMTVVVTECAFSLNGKDDRDGGAIYCESMNQISLSRVVFEGNEGDNGGAMFIKSCGNANLDNVQFKNNAGQKNSAIKLESTTINLSKIWLEGNSVSAEDESNWGGCNLKNIDGWSTTK